MKAKALARLDAPDTTLWQLRASDSLTLFLRCSCRRCDHGLCIDLARTWRPASEGSASFGAQQLFLVEIYA